MAAGRLSNPPARPLGKGIEGRQDLGRSPQSVPSAAAAGVSVLDEPVCSHGRIELVRWLREQAVSRSLHRYGSVTYDRL